MKLVLNEIKKLTMEDEVVQQVCVKGHRRLKVLYSAICRTDAKMWANGHRDLVLPRVLGHEVVALDEKSGALYTIWPGQSCNSCIYCLNGRENLCESMKIVGFHDDGGFADYISVPDSCLVLLPKDIPAEIFCFCEPAACVFNALQQAGNLTNKKVLIYGGGVVGSIAALACRRAGGIVTVVEKSEEKIIKCTPYRKKAGYTLCKKTNESDFDIAMTCCDSAIALSMAITKLKKGAKLLYFSGLQKNKEIDTNILNLVHYKELEIYGSYGPLRANMQQAVVFCAEKHDELSLLIEKLVRPVDVGSVMEDVYSGIPLKYIINFSKNIPEEPKTCVLTSSLQPGQYYQEWPDFLKTILCNIRSSDKALEGEAQKEIDRKTKPLGALGRLEPLSVQMCCIQNTLQPQLCSRTMLVFAADHGVVEEGVSAYPAKVTAQMVENFLDSGAAINVFCRKYGIELKIVDMGVDYDFSAHENLIISKIGYGTANIALQRAMTIESVYEGLCRGGQVFADTAGTTDCNILGVGEMGIGNTTSATAIISAVTGVPVADLVGRGTGVDDEGVRRKTEVILRALNLHKPLADDPVDLLSKIGGYEIAGMCGAILKAAERNTAIVLDGLISTAAGLVCFLFKPEIRDFFIAGHKSVEHGQMSALEFMSLNPVIDLDMRLGEGTGAAIAMDMIDLSCQTMREMATFDEAGVSKISL